MKYLILVVLVALLSLEVIAQGGFIRAYDFDEKGATFHNILLENDTLTIAGRILLNNENQWGLLFVQLDTSGNVLNYHTFFDENGDSYVFEQGYGLIKTIDEGYALVGQLSFRNNPVLFKLDRNAELEFVKEYIDDDALNFRHWGITEIAGGFISIGVEQSVDDFKHDAFILRTDSTGNEIWKVNYGDIGIWDSFRGMVKLNNEEILLTGQSNNTSVDVNSVEDLYSIPRAVIIDTAGSIIWEWEGELDYSGGSSNTFGQLLPVDEENWINEGSFSTVINEDQIAFQGEIVKRDSNFDVIWSTRFGSPTSFRNNFIDITKTSDGGWVACGQFYDIEAESSIGFLGGWLAKVNSDGDSLWSRVDTMFWSTVSGSTNYLSGVVALPTGSIIVCGHIDKFDPDPAKSYGWLVKVDSDGCLAPGCNPMTNNTDWLGELTPITVFPNPCTDFIKLEGIDDATIRIMNAQGQYLFTEKVQGFGMIDVRELSPGTYFAHIEQDGFLLTKKFVKL